MKDKILSILFVLYLSLIFIINLLTPDNKISISERRKLEQIPKLTKTTILNKSFMDDLDTYIADQFILREKFREIKATTNYNVFRKLDNNKIYLYKDHIFKSDYPTNKESIDTFVKKINNIKNYLTPNNKTYYSIIPDKNFYLDNKKYLNIDYNYLYNETKNLNYEYIEQRDILTLEDYYKTDIHWKQENLCKVIETLGSKLDFTPSCNYIEKT